MKTALLDTHLKLFVEAIFIYLTVEAIVDYCDTFLLDIHLLRTEFPSGLVGFCRNSPLLVFHDSRSGCSVRHLVL